MSAISPRQSRGWAGFSELAIYFPSIDQWSITVRKKGRWKERGMVEQEEGKHKEKERQQQTICLCLEHAFSFWGTLFHFQNPTSDIFKQIGWSLNTNGRFPANNHWAKPFQYRWRPDYGLKRLLGVSSAIAHPQSSGPHIHNANSIFHNRS